MKQELFYVRRHASADGWTSGVGDRWELAATDLPYAWIAPPPDFVGSVELVAELRLPNAEIADRQIVHVECANGQRPRTAT